MELSIFRVVQECLTNILRHAGSSTAGIRITQDKTCVRVEIEDAGKGIPLEKQIALQSSAQSGVGVRGMRERLRRLGGTLQIHSNGKGTLRVIAVLPITHSLMTPATVAPVATAPVATTPVATAPAPQEVSGERLEPDVAPVANPLT